MAAALLAPSPISLARTQRLLCNFAAAEIDCGLERAIAENAVIRSTADFREGVSAFPEKRTPKRSGG